LLPFTTFFFLPSTQSVQASPDFVQALPPVALESLKLLRCFGMPRTIRLPPLAKPSFAFGFGCRCCCSCHLHFSFLLPKGGSGGVAPRQKDVSEANSFWPHWRFFHQPRCGRFGVKQQIRSISVKPLRGPGSLVGTGFAGKKRQRKHDKASTKTRHFASTKTRRHPQEKCILFTFLRDFCPTLEPSQRHSMGVRRSRL